MDIIGINTLFSNFIRQINNVNRHKGKIWKLIYIIGISLLEKKIDQLKIRITRNNIVKRDFILEIIE